MDAASATDLSLAVKEKLWRAMKVLERSFICSTTTACTPAPNPEPPRVSSVCVCSCSNVVLLGHGCPHSN